MATSVQRSEAETASLEVTDLGFEVVHTTIRLGGQLLDVDEVPVGFGRGGIPGLIRASAKSGTFFHIRNARNPEAPSALLVSPAVLERFVVGHRPRRTVAELLDALPFKNAEVPRVRAKVRNNTMRALKVPELGESSGS